MEYVLLILVSVAGTVLWIKYRAANIPIREPDTTDEIALSAQELAQLQLDFECALSKNCDLPDSIRGRDAYIYWNLMRKWFDRLIAENRFDEDFKKKLEEDWHYYIKLLPQEKSARFLAMETDDQPKASTYDKEAELASRSVERIQNAFAAAIGADAIEELREARSRDFDAFDRTGRKPIAPFGSRYFPISLNPYIEECRPKHSNLRDGEHA